MRYATKPMIPKDSAMDAAGAAAGALPMATSGGDTGRAMSQENVDRFLESVEAFNRRDLDAFLSFMDPEVEFVVRLMKMEGRPYLRGHDGVREWWRGMFAVFPDFEVEVLEARDLGDTVIAAVRMRGHGGDSGVPFNEVVWQAAKTRDGKASWWQTFRTEAEALEALEAVGRRE